jgi:hypothetical protein
MKADMADSGSNRDDQPCCGPIVDIVDTAAADTSAPWMDGVVETSIRDILRVTTDITWRDRLGAWRARWGIGRMSFRIEPGLYAVGSPTAESPVFVTANYKMSFDRLRSALKNIDGWILILDTKAVNVWCSAGKGTFGTNELVNRIGTVRLPEIVSHRRLILPQLSATGVSAHEVKKRCGFRVIYGPVRADDIPVFLNARMKATPEMRRVEFPFKDRIVLAPVEIVGHGKYGLLAMAVMFLLAGLGSDGYSLSRLFSFGLWGAILLLAAWVFGAVMTPAFLPWLPGRAFSVKGAWVGVVLLIISGVVFSAYPHVFHSWASALAWLFIIPSVTSFLGMEFTGSSTYTSLSGVRKEMRLAVPLQIAGAAAGTILWIAGLFL